MDDAEFDGFIARASDPNLIAGIYNYCDRRCERCPFSARCLQFRERRRSAAERDDDEPIEVTVTRSLGRTVDMLRIIGRRLGVELVNENDTRRHDDDERDPQDARTDVDTLVERARTYAGLACPIASALRPILVLQGDQGLVDVIDTIGTAATNIPPKIYRAIWNTTEADFDATEIQNDANGSAKIARLLVDESRRAWLVLMERGQATADGVPGRLVRMLEDIDKGLAARFPLAMAFIRPGFDTERPAA